MEQCKRMLAHLHDLASSRSRHGTTQGAAGPPPRPGLLSPRRRREELQAILHSLLPSSLLISFSHNFYFFMCMFFIYACEVFDETTRRQHVFILYDRTEEDEDIQMKTFRGLKPRKEEYDGGSQCKRLEQWCFCGCSFIQRLDWHQDLIYDSIHDAE